MSYAFWADVLLALHALVPLFILGGLAATGLGAWRKWRWVRNRPFRIAHAAMMGVVLAQAMLGRLCPLTIWEHELRVRAGQATGDAPEGFIAHWVGQLLYHDLPPIAFTTAYCICMGLIAAFWMAFPPERGAGGNRTHE